MSAWNGEERRGQMTLHTKENCPNSDRLERIEEDARNHKEWRRETSDLLNNINIQLATMNERIKASISSQEERLKKYDEHIVEGLNWRRGLIGMSSVLFLNIAGTVWWAATVNEKLYRLERLHPYGSAVSSLHDDAKSGTTTTTTTTGNN